MRAGLIISGAGHLGLILWVLVGGLFMPRDRMPPVAVTEVSLMTSAEYEAMLAAAPAPSPEREPEPEPVAQPQPEPR
ncbi:MAG: hypothetical protein WCZ72_12745, partial [Gemmobacter sp.]